MMQPSSDAVSTEPKTRDASADLNSILRSNIESAETKSIDRRKDRRSSHSETDETPASKPAKSKPEPKGEDEAKAARPKDTPDKAEKPEDTENKAEKRGKSAKKAETSEDVEKTDPEISDKPQKTDKSDKDEPEAEADQAKKATPEVDLDKEGPFAPKTWDDDERKAFDEAPVEVRKALSKLVKNLTGGFTKKTMKLAEDAKLAEDVKAVIQPHHRQRMQQTGVTEGKKFAELLNLEDAYLSDPVGFAKNIIQQARISPDQLGFGDPQAADADPAGQPQVDPTVAKLQQKLAALEGVWQAATQSAQQRQAQSEQARLNDAQTAIQSFGNAVDESGNLAHPHLDKVWMHMLPIINDLNVNPEHAKLTYSDKLQRAYEDAVWANPEYRQQHQATTKASIQAQIKAAAEEARKAAEAELEKTRAKSAVSVKPRHSGSAPAQVMQKKSLDEALRDAFQQRGM